MVKDGIAWQQIDNIMIIWHVCQSAGVFAWSSLGHASFFLCFSLCARIDFRQSPKKKHKKISALSDLLPSWLKKIALSMALPRRRTVVLRKRFSVVGYDERQIIVAHGLCELAWGLCACQIAHTFLTDLLSRVSFDNPLPCWKLEKKCAKVSLGLRVVHRLRPVRRLQDAFHRDAATFPKRTNLFFLPEMFLTKTPSFQCLHPPYCRARGKMMQCLFPGPCLFFPPARIGFRVRP